MREQNIKDVRAFRERERATEEAILKKEKSKTTLTDAIKAYKARKELKTLKTAKATAKPKEKKTKAERTADTLAKKREYMRKYRAEQKAKENKNKHFLFFSLSFFIMINPSNYIMYIIYLLKLGFFII